ncbi:MAG: ferritin family protein [Lentimicrobiaceae bacterium]|jgi:rubrerythrin|nr:ferritin family protein [Lentimicrobiaceae bacterium]MDD4599119.1 ferritin family protein [Lentimicrobiaceae bacterium]HAH59008.1 rubrerythrin family protein [Bacteroidales bacterium]
MSTTEQNVISLLVNVWYLETARIRLYEIYAKQAVKDGYQQVAALFLEVAEQKRSHTKTIYRFLEESSSETTISTKTMSFEQTLKNLEHAVSLEDTESEGVYATLEAQAWDAGLKKISTKIKLFRRIKLFYAKRFNALAENIKNNRVFERDEPVKWICRKCGFIYEGEKALKNCPGCEHPQAYFEILAENY